MMKVKGFKGFFVKIILPIILKQVFKMVIEMSPELRKELGVWIKNFREKCEASSNPYDDQVSIFLMKILGY
jgi:hypothetical protein